MAHNAGPWEGGGGDLYVQQVKLTYHTSSQAPFKRPQVSMASQSSTAPPPSIAVVTQGHWCQNNLARGCCHGHHPAGNVTNAWRSGQRHGNLRFCLWWDLWTPVKDGEVAEAGDYLGVLTAPSGCQTGQHHDSFCYLFQH